MSKRTGNGDTTANCTEVPLLAPPVNVASRLRKARLQKQLFGMEQLAIKIDRFTLLERVGSGGMGEIYAAYDERLDRKVAIKLVRADASVSARAQARLLQEARALAKLSHPNVVQVYEADTFEGQVFIAMEFVRGTTLRRWLEEHAGVLPERARTSAVLNQFLAIGRGLAAAHAAGVVHRDFKPDNVLVGDDGRPRVVDFGLARAVLEDLDEPRTDSPSGELSGAPEAPGSLTVPRLETSVENTTHGRIVGTPRYMSPEQIRTGAADGRSDQFSFCVALYHALYGEWPFAGKTLEALMHALGSNEVTQPSRNTAVPAGVRKALLRGLARDPAHRFPDMESLLDALEVERHHRQRRTMAISTVGIAVAVGIGAVVGIAVYRAGPGPTDPCEGVNAPVEALWNPLRREVLGDAFMRTGLPYAASTWNSTAERINAYTGRWAQSRRFACEAAQVRHEDPTELTGRRLRCLERSRRRLELLLDVFADIDASTLQHAGQAVAELPDLELCENLEALAANVSLPEPRVAAAVDETRDRLARAQTALRLGRYRDAITLARAALVRAETLRYDPVHADALYTIGWLLVHHGRPDEVREGEELMVRASNLAEGVRYYELVATIWNHLALSSYQNHVDNDRGHAWAERAQATVRSIGEPALLLAQSLRHRGLLHYKDYLLGKDHPLGKAHHLDTARDCLEDALQVLPAEVSPFVRTPYLLSLANILRAQQRPDEALALYQKALTTLVPEAGELHPTVADVRFELATFHAQRAELDLAVEIMSAALRAYEVTFGQDHPRVGKALLELAGTERERGNLAVALAHVYRTKAIYEKAYPPDHIEHATVHEHLGAIAFRQGRYHDAVSAFRCTLELRTRHLPFGHVDIGQTQLNLAEAHVQVGQYNEALAAVISAAKILGHYRDDSTQAFLNSLRGQALLGLGRHTEAAAALELAVSRFGKRNEYPAERAAAYWALARALEASGGDRERARTLSRRARDLYATQGESTRIMRTAIERWLRAHD